MSTLNSLGSGTDRFLGLIQQHSIVRNRPSRFTG